MKKKLIMILCAVVSLSLAACGGTVETDSDSRTEREVEDDDSRDKEDKKKGKDIVKKGVTYHNLDNSCIYFDVQYVEHDIKCTSDNMDFILSEYIASSDSFDHFEKYKETDDFIIYKIYMSDEATVEFLNSEIQDSLCLDDYEDYLDNYVKESEKDKFVEEYALEVRRRYRDEVEKVYDIYQETKDYPIEVIVGVKDTTEYYKIESASPIFMCNIDAFLEGVFYLKTDKIPDLPNDSLDSIGYSKRSSMKNLSFYIPEEVSANRDGSSEDRGMYESDDIKKVERGSVLASPSPVAETMSEESQASSTTSSTKTETSASDSASTTSQMESERKGFFPRSDIDYQALSDKFAGTYVPVDGDSEFMIHEYDEERVSYSQENGTAYMFMEQYRLDWWDYSHIISYDGTTVELSYGEEYGVVKLIYIDENTVSYRGKKYTRYKEDSQTLENINVESEVATIRDYYYTTQNNLGNYMLEEHPSLTMYHEAGFPVKIFAKSGYNDWDYTREYFYHDEELYFAFVYNNNEQHRLYFKDGIMIRYIDENGNTYDYGSLDAYSDWADKVKNESNSIYPTMPNCGA